MSAILGMAGIAAGQTAVNQGLGMINQHAQIEGSKELARYQQDLNKEMADYTYNLTNTTAYMDQLKRNRLNPTLALKGAGGGGQVVSASGGSGSGVGMVSNRLDLGDAMQLQLMEAQKANIEADTANKQADSGLKLEQERGVTANIDLMAKQMQSVTDQNEADKRVKESVAVLNNKNIEFRDQQIKQMEIEMNRSNASIKQMGQDINESVQRVAESKAKIAYLAEQLKLAHETNNIAWANAAAAEMNAEASTLNSQTNQLFELDRRNEYRLKHGMTLLDSDGFEAKDSEGRPIESRVVNAEQYERGSRIVKNYVQAAEAISQEIRRWTRPWEGLLGRDGKKSGYSVDEYKPIDTEGATKPKPGWAEDLIKRLEGRSSK